MPKNEEEGLFERIGKILGVSLPVVATTLTNPFLGLSTGPALATIGYKRLGEAGKKIDESKEGKKLNKTVKEGGPFERGMAVTAPVAGFATPVPVTGLAGLAAVPYAARAGKKIDISLGLDKKSFDKNAKARVIKKLLGKKPFVRRAKDKAKKTIEAIPESKEEMKEMGKRFIKKHELATGGPIEKATKWTTVAGGSLIPIPGTQYAGVLAAKHVGKLGRKADVALGLGSGKKGLKKAAQVGRTGEELEQEIWREAIELGRAGLCISR